MMPDQRDAILVESLAYIEAALGPEAASIRIGQVVIGAFFTGVQLTTGNTGNCATPLDDLAGAACCPVSAQRSRDAGWRPGTLRHMPALALAREAPHAEGIRRGAAIAAINALADLCWERGVPAGIAVEAGLDGFETALPLAGENIVVVGAFVPFLRKLRRLGLSYRVLEKDPTPLKADEIAYFRPSAQAAEIVPQADLLLITGSSLVGGTLEELLSWARPEARVTIIGPSVGLIPAPFLRRGADFLGTMRVTEPALFMAQIAEGATALDFLGSSAEKMVLSSRSALNNTSR